MGLNIGVEVKKFHYTGEQCGQSHPKDDGLEDRFWEFLSQKFPTASFGIQLDITEQKYDFGIRFVHYADKFTAAGFSMTDMYRAIIDFILDNFGFVEENLEMALYYSP